MDYQRISKQTSYPGIGSGLVYTSMGMAGEAGELLEKAINGAPLQDFSGELGDVLWFISQTASECGFRLDELLAIARQREDERPEGLVPSCIDLVLKISRINESVKKMLRDDNGVLELPRKEQLERLVSDTFASWVTVAREANIDPLLCAQQNCEKLASRERRGVIQGSGDNR
jgi:NTP pyrophosphatase (non-canonical NTP hydrolase)